MTITSFLNDPAAIRRILGDLGIWEEKKSSTLHILHPQKLPVGPPGGLPPKDALPVIIFT